MSKDVVDELTALYDKTLCAKMNFEEMETKGNGRRKEKQQDTTKLRYKW